VSDPIVYDEANGLQKFVRRFAAGGPGSWLFARVAPQIDRPVHRLTGGRHTFASLISGLPVVMLTTTGAKSGQPRTVPVLGIPTSDGVAVIASNWGQQRHPAWYHNLRAHPDVTVQIGAEHRSVHARVATAEERARLWPRAVELYGSYADYQARTDREIPLVILEPR
jgi:deazaflavin-dependent oxidoreductase (nitroreductase family)